MEKNPFTYGDPISHPGRFFGRQREIEQVFSRLCNPEFESSSLVGERRIGKTSLLNYLADPEVRRSHGLNPDRYLFVYIDLQLVGKSSTPIQLWHWLLQQIARQYQDAEIVEILKNLTTSNTIDNFALEELFARLDGKDKYIVFLLDEFENVTDNQNFDPGFFFAMRSLAIRHKLALVTSSQRELIELCHSEAIRASPFFNIFANINLRLFKEDEARKLITTSLQNSGVSFTEKEITMILRLAGCHPFFLQAACYFLYEAYAHNLSVDERKKYLMKEFFEEASPHLDDYWRNSSDSEKIVLTVLALLERQGKASGHSFNIAQLRSLYARSDQTLLHLEKRSMLAAKNSSYALFNSVLGDWIVAEITNTLNDQQNYEEWLKSNKGLLDRISVKFKNEVGEILPKVGSKYRELFINWLSDPRILVVAADLLRGALVSFHI